MICPVCNEPLYIIESPHLYNYDLYDQKPLYVCNNHYVKYCSTRNNIKTSTEEAYYTHNSIDYVIINTINLNNNSISSSIEEISNPDNLNLSDLQSNTPIVNLNSLIPIPTQSDFPSKLQCYKLFS